MRHFGSAGSCQESALEWRLDIIISQTQKIKQMKQKKEKQIKPMIPLMKIMDYWKKGHTCEGDKGGSFNLNLYLDYCKVKEMNNA